jgi:hypothetical protein
MAVAGVSQTSCWDSLLWHLLAAGVRLVVEVRRGFSPQLVLNQLYKSTRLQLRFSTNMVSEPRNICLASACVAELCAPLCDVSAANTLIICCTACLFLQLRTVHLPHRTC